MPQHKFAPEKFLPHPPPEDGLTDKERIRRTATHPQMNWKEGIYKGNKMEAPRGADPCIQSKDFTTTKGSTK